MRKKQEKERPDRRTGELVTAEEALSRMKNFSQRREKFIAAIKKS
ncbi:MAG: hypothetical protein ABI539_12955 [Acidobacteriota bacterium]